MNRVRFTAVIAFLLIGMLNVLAEDASVSADAARGSASGRVILNDGFVQAGLTVYLHQVKPDQILGAVKAKTDERGIWTAADVVPGTYIVSPVEFGKFGWRENEEKEVRAGERSDCGVEYFSTAFGSRAAEGSPKPPADPVTLPGFGRAKGVVRLRGEGSFQDIAVYLNQIDPQYRPALRVASPDDHGFWSLQNVLPGKYVITQHKPFLALQYEENQVQEVRSGKTADFGIAEWEPPEKGRSTNRTATSDTKAQQPPERDK